MFHFNQSEKKQSCKIGGVNAENSSDEKTTPPLSLLLETHMNTKPADDKKNGDPRLPKTKRKKTKE
jgi:hypothetical protein